MNYTELKTKALKGSIYLTIRQMTLLLVSFLGIIIFSNILGAKNYGYFTTILALNYIVLLIAGWGVASFVIRRKNISQYTLNACFTLLLFSSIILSSSFYFLLPFVSQWIGIEHLLYESQWLIISIPFQVLSSLFVSTLDKSFEYKKIMLLDFSGVFIYYLVSLILLELNEDILALVVGFVFQQLYMCIYSFKLSRFKSIISINKKLLLCVFKYGLSFSLAALFKTSKQNMVFIFIAKYIGAEAVTTVAICNRLVEAMIFLKDILLRLALPIISKLKSDEDVGELVSLFVRFQTIIIGLSLQFGLILLPFVLPYIFPELTESIQMYIPFIASIYLISSMFDWHSKIFELKGALVPLVICHASLFIIYVILSPLLLPEWGLNGYLLSEMILLSVFIPFHYWLNTQFVPIKFIHSFLMSAIFIFGYTVYPQLFLSLYGVLILLFHKIIFKMVKKHLLPLKTSE